MPYSPKLEATENNKINNKYAMKTYGGMGV
jgi:hypothetical protein